MSKKLVAFFSASGVTKKVAETVAAAAQADLFEIVPQELYTADDLNYMNTESRSTVEMKDLNCRPAVASCVEGMEDYDVIFVGYPVWWGREPSVVDTFLDAYDMTGKKIIPFCTSGGSPVDGGVARMAELTAGKATVCGGIRLAADASAEEIAAWVNGLSL